MLAVLPAAVRQCALAAGTSPAISPLDIIVRGHDNCTRSVRATMPPSCLTVLAQIKPGELDALRAVLRPIGDDIKGTHQPPGGRPHIAFMSSRAIHFARLAILTDPDRGPGRARLLYASVYDGTFEAHAAELAALTSDL